MRAALFPGQQYNKLYFLIKQLLPNPKHRHSSDHTKHEVREIALAEQLYIQQMGDEGAGITAHYAHDEVHAGILCLRHS